jgi:hypothetical protein
MSEDLIPRSEEKFRSMAKNMLTVLLEHRDEYGYGDKTLEWTYLSEQGLPKYNTYEDAYKKWEIKSTRTPHSVLALHEARKEFEPVIRKLAAMLKQSLRVTNLDLESMGLPPRPDGTKTHAPVANRPPFAKISTPLVGCLYVDYYDDDDRKRAKPHGQHGVECCWVISDTPVKSLKGLLHSTFDTKTPLVLEFDREDCGRTVYLALRWENTRGDKGPFTRILSAAIP